MTNYNNIVDKAAKPALDFELPELTFQFVPHRDFRARVNSYCHKLWQKEWSLQINNKLSKTYPDLSLPHPLHVVNRKQESILTRLQWTYVFYPWLDSS